MNADILSAGHSDRLWVDIGTSCLTGLRRDVLRDVAGLALFNAHPVFATVPLSAADSRRLGSDFVRAGLVFDPPELDDDRFRDIYDVEWLVVDGAPAPLSHPLEKASVAGIRPGSRPRFAAALQVPEPEGRGAALVVLDAPCPGLLDLTLGLRNPWQFFDDVSSRSREAASGLGAQISKPFRSRLAAYIAVSAAKSMSARFCAWRGAVATPMLACACRTTSCS